MNSHPNIQSSGPSDSHQRRIYTVSELTFKVKKLLEESYPFVWINGEISNFRVPASGHYYFTLKDEAAQINAVMFRNQNRTLIFDPEDGMNITGLGRISVYEPRGTYQIIFEYLEPKGTGAIQLAFEQLKTRLFEEGLFDEAHKTPLPFLPKKISIITSPTGAVVHDILKIINRRFSNLQIEIIPVKVQGDGAEHEIVSAIEMLNLRSNSDLAILARGGGSLEDFHAFNAEIVARAIFASNIPIISAVGHETDFCIADFVADLRAPTPSAAAELAVPLKQDLLKRVSELSTLLAMRFVRNLEDLQIRVQEMSNRLVHPNRKIIDLRLKLDDLMTRLVKTFNKTIVQQHKGVKWQTERLFANNPLVRTKFLKDKLDLNHGKLLNYKDIFINTKRFLLREAMAGLHALSPEATLSRGYSITRTIPDAAVVRDPKKVSIGQDLEVTVAKGLLICKVKGK
ncbi:MAG: exodeoxyribonuclease VII large subunit [Deltaproteobacteria bacterium]|nr:exodeoxyribonuclease VII large subunit [Deltaproteobacteria bacterium]